MTTLGKELRYEYFPLPFLLIYRTSFYILSLISRLPLFIAVFRPRSRSLLTVIPNASLIFIILISNNVSRMVISEPTYSRVLVLVLTH
jgi:hypothetical protein